MKKENKDSNTEMMRDEYDFSGGVRGKHYMAYREGHTVLIHKEDGSSSVQYFTQEDGAIMLDPDVKTYFPDSESVNKALRKSLKITFETDSDEANGSRMIARMPWREQSIKGVQYPEGYEASKEAFVRALE